MTTRVMRSVTGDLDRSLLSFFLLCLSEMHGSHSEISKATYSNDSSRPATLAEAETAQHEISILLQNGADPGKQIPGRFGTVLQQAAYSGKLDLVELLVNKKGENNTVGGEAVGEMLPFAS